MAKQINVGVGGVKKASKVYTSVGGIVRQIKKGVCSVSGFVKEFFAGNMIYENGSEGYTLLTANTRSDGLGCYLKKESNYISFWSFGNSNGSDNMIYSTTVAYTLEPINLTDYTSIKATFTVIDRFHVYPGKHYAALCMSSEHTGTSIFNLGTRVISKNYIEDNGYNWTNNTSYTLTKNIADLPSSINKTACYIGFGLYGGDYSKYGPYERIRLTKIELVK